MRRHRVWTRSNTYALLTLITAASAAYYEATAGRSHVPSEPPAPFLSEQPARAAAQRLAPEVPDGIADPFDARRFVPLAEPFPDPDPEPVQPPEPAAQPMPRLLGTTVVPGGGSAIIEIEGQRARTVSVGDTIAGFTLSSVERGRAYLVRPDSTLTLNMRPGAS